MRSPADLEPRVASAILAAMTSVALADGALDPRERALLDRFRAEMTDDLLPTHVEFRHPDELDALLEWMRAAALADGPFVHEERLVLREIGRGHGATDAALARAERAD